MSNNTVSHNRHIILKTTGAFHLEALSEFLDLKKLANFAQTAFSST